MKNKTTINVNEINIKPKTSPQPQQSHTNLNGEVFTSPSVK